MTPFSLRFAAGRIGGEGRDVVGRFTFAGTCDEQTGEVRLLKQYLGRHQVLYLGQSDGEGSIHGTWHIGEHESGSFRMRPTLARPTGEEPIQEIG